MKTYYPFLIIVIAITFSSCRKPVENDEPIAIFYLGEEDTAAYFPFNGNFAPIYYSYTDTVIDFFDQYDNSYLVDFTDPYSDRYYQFETGMSTFLANDYIFQYYVNPKVDMIGHERSMTVLLEVGTNQDPHDEYQIDFRLPLDSNQTDSTTYLLDSLVVSDTVYKEVLSCKAYHFPPPQVTDSIIPSRLYYSAAAGIVKVEMSDGSGWEMIKK